MNLDQLEKDKDSIGYSDVIKTAEKKIDILSIYSSEYDSAKKIKELLLKWYIKGYFQALDDYKKIAR